MQEKDTGVKRERYHSSKAKPQSAAAKQTMSTAIEPPSRQARQEGKNDN
jgi:hypothetical protein